MTLVKLAPLVSSVFGYTGEQLDSYIKLYYLRSRWLSTNTARFTSKDTWRDYDRPLSLNGWSYTEGDPVNQTDPSGLCANCYVIYFTGAGNEGDQDNRHPVQRPNLGGSELDDDMLPGEESLVNLLRDKGIITIALYPYGTEIHAKRKQDKSLGGIDENRNLRDVVGPAAFNQSEIPYAKALEVVQKLIHFQAPLCITDDKPSIDDTKVNLTFVAYSGGGQMAYSTAQKLKGKVFVDNLIMFGSPFRAFGGLTNIGRIWDFKGEQDWLYGSLGNYAGWDAYNRGYRETGISGALRMKKLNIYNNGATACTLFGKKKDYDHFGYFSSDPFEGLECKGSYNETISPQKAEVFNKTRLDANLTLISGIIEGTIK